MDVREKLVEILKQAPFEGKVLDEWWWEEKIRIIADHLISNGVTVQECGSWKYYHKQNIAVCTECGFERDLDENFGRAVSCPNCGAYMRQQTAEGE